MTDKLPFVCLVSPESSIYTRSLIKVYRKWVIDNAAQLHCVVVDGPNRHNVRVFENLNLADASIVARDRGKAKISEIAVSGVLFYTWDDVLLSPRYMESLEHVQEVFRTSASFRRHCLNETFSHLQPKFRRIGVARKRDAQVALCTQFLLEEIALKISVFTDPSYVGELMPHHESGLFQRIYMGEYLNCERVGTPFRVVTLTRSRESELRFPTRHTFESINR